MMQTCYALLCFLAYTSNIKKVAEMLKYVLLCVKGCPKPATMGALKTSHIKLPIPLKNLPYNIGNWKGNDLEIPPTTREYMEKNFADDYINRRYINAQAQMWVDIYVVYCATKPGGMLGHQPLVCYPGNGWIHDSTKKTQFITQTGLKVDCLIHRFHKPAPTFEQTEVLNFFVVNGHLSTDQSSFKGLSGRKFNLSGNPARYATQIQISSMSEDMILKAAENMTDEILYLLPDKTGRVNDQWTH